MNVNFSAGTVHSPVLFGKKALVVEDDPDIRTLNKMALKLTSEFDEGVDEAGRTADALTLLKENKYDLLLTDNNLKEAGDDGLKLIRKIQNGAELQKPSAIVMMSGDDPADLKEKVETLGIRDMIQVLLTKPCSLDKIMEAALQALQVKSS